MKLSHGGEVPDELFGNMTFALQAMACDLSADRDTKVNLADAWCWYAVFIKEKVRDVLQQRVAELSSGLYRIELATQQEAGYEVFGLAMYFRRVNTETGGRRYFFIGPYLEGFRYCGRERLPEPNGEEKKS